MGSLKIGTRLPSLSSTDDDQPHNVMGSEEAKGRKNRLREYENGTANFPHAKVVRNHTYIYYNPVFWDQPLEVHEIKSERVLNPNSHILFNQYFHFQALYFQRVCVHFDKDVSVPPTVYDGPGRYSPIFSVQNISKICYGTVKICKIYLEG